ncbi:uncharacterized protein K460DRAFT_307622 [Cucurbitaria berberidis CBS 394.84]|uniref:Altered inheritance of mitochondria protein 6 n=1 Tax=Cucurbitaria berberidis CBS 394.84 TaxID=1168544 RepID=A0A9P4GKD1_9PLEO|nr:uncharacterized protein K460DRAFT_307622 [Cucurbitaria berberidis CBS 394.84]KAF1847918.1 hypothetical protein K460DRAFT_307622 [Cucurbitaria berberidis CBS 394.84]
MRFFAITALFAGSSAALYIPEVSEALQNILKKTDKSDKYKYPTEFTREIFPKPFHSHNDYWRDVPFYSGLSYGAVSIEADVYLIDGTLYVGHEHAALTKKRTLDSLYIQPILDTLKRQNPSTPFTQPDEQNGVFDTASSQTLYLFIDLKTPANVTWPAVLSALEPLRSGKWLSTYDGKKFQTKPITVIGTGNTQLADVQNYLPRDVFLDGPLAKLNTTEYANLTANESPIASTNFEESFGVVKKREFNVTQLDILKQQVETAHKKGIKTRYWNQPNYPVGTRNAVWRTLWDGGVDLLNVDDLKAAAEFWEGAG